MYISVQEENLPENGHRFARTPLFDCCEMAYAHCRMARDVVSHVLGEKVEEGYMTEDEAVGSEK